MSIRTLLLRTLAIWSLAFWLGGFTFYSSVVIPVLHDRLGSPLETGLVTQRVTDVLNASGFATITLGWIGAFLKYPSQQSGRRRGRWAVGALVVTTVCLAILVALHRVLDRRLDGAEMQGFYPLHRLYLWVSTVQWFANMVLLTCWAGVGHHWSRETQAENPQVFSGLSKPEIPP